MTRPLAHWGFLAALVALWGSSFLLNRIAVESIPPLTLTAGRIVFAGLLIVPVALLSGAGLPRTRAQWGAVTAIAVVGNILPFALLAWAVETIDSGLAGVCMAVMPLIVAGLAHVFVAGERMTAQKAAGFTIGFMGVVVLVGPPVLLKFGGAPLEVLSQLAALAAAACYGVNAIITRRAPPMATLSASAGVMLVAAGLLTPVALLVEAPDVATMSGHALLAGAALGLGATAIATLVYFRAIGAAGPSFVSQINYLIPPAAVFLGWLLLDEVLEPRAFLALGVILTGIWVSNRRPKPQAKAS